MRDETRHERRRRALDDLREELEFEGAVLVGVDGWEGAAVLSSMSDDSAKLTDIILRVLGDFLPGFLSDAYEAAGAPAVDTVDRMEGET